MIKIKHSIFDAGKNRTIETYDGVFDGKELLSFHRFAQQQAYSINRISSGLISDKSLATLKCDLSFPEAIRMGLISSPNFKPFIEILHNKKLRLRRSYINLCTSDDLFPYHVDSENEEELTMLYFVNSHWEPMWEGETHFASEDLSELIFSSSFIPGRLAVFTPTIPHKSSQPSRRAEEFRFTYAMKFVSQKDVGWKDSFDLKERL